MNNNLKYNPILNFNEHDSYLILIAIGLSVFLIDYLIIGVILCILLYFYLIYQDDFLLFFSILLFLVFIGQGVGAALRVVFQLVGFSVVIFLFFKNYMVNKTSFPRVPKIFILLVLLLYSSIFLSAIFSKYPQEAIEPTLRLTTFLFIIYLFYSLINNFQSIKTVLFSLFMASAIMAVAVFYDFFIYGFSLENLFVVSYRASGIISNYNATSGFFAVTIPITFTLLFSNIKRFKKIYLSIFLFIQLMALLSTGSRSAYLAVIVSSLIILFNINRLVFKRVLFIGLILGIAILFINPLLDTLSLLLRFERGVTFRDKLWEISFSMIKDHFLFGIGPGSYRFEMFNYFPVMLDSFEGKVFITLFENTEGRNVSHNFYLMLFSDLGIPGFLFSLLYPLVLIKFINKIIHNVKKNKNIDYFIIVAIAGTIGGMFVRGLFENLNLMTYGWIYVDLPMWLLIVILIYYYNTVSNKKADG